MSEVYAGVDLGGTTTTCAIADASGKILAESHGPTQAHDGPQAVLDRIGETINNLKSVSGSKPVALGLALPGLVDLRRGVTKFLPNLPTQWRDIPVRDILAPRVGCPVYLLNDVRAATLGELTFGHGKTASTMIFFALGTGIGGGVVVDGKLRLGPLGAAGELGHQTVQADGPRCGCGNRGCLESFASGPALVGEGVRLLRSGQAPRLYEIVGGDDSKVTPKTVAQAAEDGDERVHEAIVRASTYLGIGVANMVTALHPDLIVLGGGVAGIGPLLFDTVRSVVRERVRMFPTDDIRIEPSLLGDEGGVLGAVALAMKGGLQET